MKFQKLEPSHDHERFVMHIGREETRILVALLVRARIHTPRLDQTMQMLGRIRQMEKEFRHALGETPADCVPSR